MKIDFKILLLLMILFQCSLIKAQNVVEVDFASPTKEEKQLIIANLAIPSEAGSAAILVSKYRIKEAVPNLLTYYSRQEPKRKFYFLGAIASCEYKNAMQLFYDFIDSVDVFRLDSVFNYKADVAALLIELGDYSRRDLIYDDLEKNFDGSSVAIQAANVLDDLIINVPAEEAKAKDQLLNIARNAKYDFARYMALVNLFEIYKESMLPVLKERFVNDTTYSTKLCILKYMLSEVKTSETVSYLKQQAATEPNLSIRYEILNVLLTKFSNPNMYQYIKNNKYLLAEWKDKKLIDLALRYFQVKIDSNITEIARLDSLISFHSQCFSLGWLGNSTFNEQLQTLLSESKVKLSAGDSLGTAIKIKLYQSLINEEYKDSLDNDGKFVTSDGYKFLYYYPQCILERLPKLPTVKLVNSTGTKLTGGTLQYYEGAWKDAVNNNNGTFTVPTTLKNVSLRMNYAYGSQTKSNVTVGADTVVFQTVNAAVQLKNSLGAFIDQGTVQYYSGAWRDFGTTTNGVATKELLPNNYSFRMSYAFASNDKQQNVSTNSVVVFQTVNATVQLKNSLGSLIDVGTVQYYSGAWRNFGTTSTGIASLELLPNNYSFRITHEFISNDKAQNIGANNIVEFRTVLCNVNVTDAQNLPVNNAIVSYYSGAWRNLGTALNGTITKELLPANLTFRAVSGTRQADKTQNILTNNIVEIKLP